MDEHTEVAKPTELNLDPEDWEEAAALGRRMVDDMIAFLRGQSEGPAFRKVPREVRESFRTALPRAGIGAAAAYEEFLRSVLPYPKGNIHPRFWGWVEGTGTVAGMLSGLLAAAMNSNAAFGDQSAAYMELQAIEWLKELTGYAAEAAGLLVSGGSMANLVGLAAARDAHGDRAISATGVDPSRRALRLYASVERHNSIDRAVRLLGLGSDNLVLVPVRDDYRIDVEALGGLIARDRAAGLAPFCLIANVGTVNTGAIDPVRELASIARSEGLWLHADGAFGALARLLPEYAPALDGLEAADSLAFDLHKWLYVQYECGCILVKDPAALEAPFKQGASYLVPHERGLSAGPAFFADRGPELSRSFRALKLWMQLKEHGLDAHAKIIKQNVAQARYLAALVESSSALELMAPTSLNIVCFRYNPGDLDASTLDRLNREIVMSLQEQGIAIPSYTILRGRYAIRVAITNHRSRNADFELLVRECGRLGKELAPRAAAG